MTSKKRTGNDPEVMKTLQAAQLMKAREAVMGALNDAGSGNVGGVGSSGKAPGTDQSSAEQGYMAGRRAMAYELLESGGLGYSRLGHELIYLLPDEFISFYGKLFGWSFVMGDQSVMGGEKDSGLEKAKGAMGMVTGSDTKLQSSGTGKRWKNTPMAIGDEGAFKVKGWLDQELMRLTREAARMMVETRRPKKMNQDLRVQAGIHPGMASQGPGAGIERTAGVGNSDDPRARGANQCAGYLVGLPALEISGVPGGFGPSRRRCGRFIKDGMKFCPSCGTRV